jgi:hypothetical protein
MTLFKCQDFYCGRSLVYVAGSNPAGGQKCLSLVTVVCCQAEASATGRSLVQGRPTDCVFVERVQVKRSRSASTVSGQKISD